MEVTAALSSSDKKIVSDMKETMKQFQVFLANFEVIFFILFLFDILSILSLSQFD